MLRKQSLVIFTPNRMRIVIDEDSDPRNVQMFKNVKMEGDEGDNEQKQDERVPGRGERKD